MSGAECPTPGQATLVLAWGISNVETKMNYAKAKELAETWVRLRCDGTAELVEERTIKKPYGWVFFYRGKKGALAGNAPIIIDRVNGELRVTGTAKPITAYLEEYEALLPPARLAMIVPEEPSDKAPEPPPF